MIPVRGITICRTHEDDRRNPGMRMPYDEILEITLVRNMRHLQECVVVTSPEDTRTQAVCARVPNVRVFQTDAFTRYGARFNKGLAMEEGLTFLGREGWILIWDADILLPESLRLDGVVPGFLWGAHRRILEHPRSWTPTYNWVDAPLSRDLLIPGYFQLFHASDPRLANQPMWYDVTFPHAGGGDAHFSELWPQSLHKHIPSHVLHLGPKDTHWFGTDPAGRMLMDKMLIVNGWDRARKSVNRNAPAEAGPLPGRVFVPGYPPPTYQMPAERGRKTPIQ